MKVESKKLQAKDLINVGVCCVEMETVKDLEGLEKTKVTSVNYNMFGDNPHIKVVGA